MTEVLSFLQSLADSGRKVNTIKGYITAIAHRHALFSQGSSQLKLSDLDVVQTWVRGLTLLHPEPRIRVPEWNLDVVLSALKKPPFYPLKDASLKHLTLRTAFLLALTSARRASEVHALRVDTMVWKADAVYAYTDERFLAKVHTQWHADQAIVFPALYGEKDQELRKLCVRTQLKHYVNRTLLLRQHKGASTQLLLCYGGKEKGQPVSVQRISNWLKLTVQLAYQSFELPLPQVKGHQVRKQATSWADLAGVSPEDICRAATWRSSNVFARHYKLRLKDVDTRLSHRVLQLSASSAAERAVKRRLATPVVPSKGSQ